MDIITEAKLFFLGWLVIAAVSCAQIWFTLFGDQPVLAVFGVVCLGAAIFGMFCKLADRSTQRVTGEGR